MFDVLVYVYEHYWRGDVCPELPLLGRKLSAAGFDADEIQQALSWLAGLNSAAQHADLIQVHQQRVAPAYVQSPLSMRIYSDAEQQHLVGAGVLRGGRHTADAEGKTPGRWAFHGPGVAHKRTKQKNPPSLSERRGSLRRMPGTARRESQ